MICPSCGHRRAKRACPALGTDICPVCCGTKRLVEIRCPSDCGYLASARQHPPAVVQRRHERDARFLWPFVNGLNEGQYRLFLFLQTVVRRYRPQSAPALQDADVADAAGSLAATLETAERGIIYDHQATSLVGQRLLGELKAAIDELSRANEGQRSSPRDSAEPLRRIERASREAAAAYEGSTVAYLDLIDRFLAEVGAAAEQAQAESPAEPSRLIISG